MSIPKRKPTKDATPPGTNIQPGRREPSPSGPEGGPRSIAALHQMPPLVGLGKGEGYQGGTTRRKRSSEIANPEAQQLKSAALPGTHQRENQINDATKSDQGTTP